MRIPVLLLAAMVLATLSPVQGQMTETSFPGDRHLRVAYGDVPLSPAVEPDGRWNVVEYHRIQHEGGPLREAFVPTQGFIADGATCSCGNMTVLDAGGAIMAGSDADVAAGSYVVALSYHLERPSSASGPLIIVFRAEVPRQWTAAFYLREGQSVSSRTGTPQVLPGAERPEYTIHQFFGDEATTWAPVFEVNFSGLAPPTPSPSPDMTPWLYAAAAFVLGLVVWAMLVRAGIVQKRTRKQVATTAAHEQIAAKEAPAVLEGKKRALLAALKDVELAHQGREMDDATYDAVKADFKRQAVTVMRALETVEAEAKAQ